MQLHAEGGDDWRGATGTAGGEYFLRVRHEGAAEIGTNGYMLHDKCIALILLHRAVATMQRLQQGI